MGQGKDGLVPATDGSGEPNSSPTEDGADAFTLPGEFCNHKCEEEKIISSLVQQKPGKNRWNTSLRMMQKG